MAILRDYIKATVGFEKLGEATGTQPKSLIRMFGPRGNPQARNYFGIIGYYFLPMSTNLCFFFFLLFIAHRATAQR
jgi:hypothetical protein